MIHLKIKKHYLKPRFMILNDLSYYILLKIVWPKINLLIYNF